MKWKKQSPPLSRGAVLLFALLVLATTLSASCKDKDEAPIIDGATPTTPDGATVAAGGPAPLPDGVPPIPPRPDRGEEVKVILLYSTAVSGELTDCGCKGHPRGGLARKSKYINGLRDANDHLVHLDGGELFFPQARGQVKITDIQKNYAKVIAKSMTRIGVDAINVGHQDLRAGLDFLTDELARPDPKTELPFISANLVVGEEKKRPFPAYKIIQSGGIQIGVFGLLDDLPENEYGLSILDPKETAKEMVAILKDRCDLVVGLYAMKSSKASRLAKEAPGVNLVIASARSGRPKARPMLVGESLCLDAGARGMYIGRMDLTFNEAASESLSPRKFVDLKDERARLEAQRVLYDGTVKRDPEFKAALAKVDSRLREIGEQLSEAGSGFTFENSVVSVELEFPDDEEVLSWVEGAGVKPKTPRKKVQEKDKGEETNP